MDNQTDQQHPNEHAPAAEAAQNHEPEHHEPNPIPDDLPKVKTWAAIVAGVVILVAFAGLFVLGWIPRERRIAAAEAQSKAVNDSAPTVMVAKPKQVDKAIDVRLPADARAFQSTAIFPRANGYIKRSLVDIGDQVKQGQLLAVIDQPDVDADLNQARAAQAQAEANLVKSQNDFELSQSTLTRYEGFSKSGGVTQQQLDQTRSAFTQAQSTLAGAKANVQASDAAVQRLVALQGFENVIAPFGGKITFRNYDVGALMSSTNAAPGKEMFDIADTDTLRVFVNVPQPYITTIKTGQQAFLAVRNYPGREFTGTIARAAGTLDPATRTMSFEIDFPNSDGSLFAGMYAEARLHLTQDQPPTVLPTSSLVFDSGGTRVWVVSADQKVYSQKVTVGRDFGTEIEISDGLKGDEQVVTNPGERLADGSAVQLSNPESPEAKPPGTPQQAMAH
jgi:RND family efflux transporter MFP subunit